MKRTAFAYLLAVALAAPNIVAQTNNPPAPAAPAPATTTENPPAARQDPGVRKLSRRERKDRMKSLPDQHRQFLQDVEPIMMASELDTFLLLETDAQREIHMIEFWRRRDKAQGTTNNTFKKQYYDRLETAKEKYRNVASDRSRIYLIHGEPSELLDIDCLLLVPMQIWKYVHIPGMGHDVRFLFFQPRVGVDFKIFTPLSGEALGDLVSQDAIGSAHTAEGAIGKVFGPINPFSSITRIDAECKYGNEVMKAVAQAQLNKFEIMKAFNPPPMNEEDVHKILRSVVLANPDAKPLTADFSVRFPAKQGGRTAAEMTVLVPRSELVLKDVEGTKVYSLDVIGEVLKNDQLFENYRYRFDYPGDVTSDKLAIVIDRFLRPADYQARIKVVDANGNSEAIIEKALTVPELQDTPEQIRQKESAAATVAQLKDNIESGETRVRIIPLTDDLVSGVQQIETIAYGDAIKAVEFYLDGKKVMVKRQPPYNLDLDFGHVPQARRVRVVALNDKGEAITGDEILVNTGNEPFRVRIMSPRVAIKLKGKTRVEIAVNTPEGKKLEKLELYLNDKRVATLYDAPYVQTIDVPSTEGVGYLRAVATLDDNAQPPVEDVVMINTPQFMQEVNVHLIELPTTVLRNGRPVNNLPETAFKVLDEGKPVKVTKFEHVTNLPLSIGMAMDTSSSMQPRMDEARKSASQFFSNVMKKGDRAFLVSFDSQPQLIQRWSPLLADVNAGLAKLRAEEATALYDAIVYSLYNFLGVKGQKALVIITDGKDTSSKFSFDQALEYARRSAVPIYSIAIGVRATEVDVRYKLGKFSTETGGNTYYIDNVSELRRICDDIQTELRSQYILGFYPPENVKPGSKWHEVTVQVSEGRAKTIRGYYP